MPHKKHTTKKTAKSTRTPARSTARKLSKPTRTPKVPRNIRIPQRLESYLQAEALLKAGLYNPRKKLDPKTFTDSQARNIRKRYAEIQKHGAYIQGIAQRPFQRTTRGYKLNPAFKQVKRKAAQKIPGVIKTNQGVIVPRELLKSSPRILKDGTLVYRSKRAGKERTIYSGTLTPAQTLRFIKQVEDGTFKFPKGKNGKPMRCTVVLFNAFTLRGMWHVLTLKNLQFVMSQYQAKFEDTIKKYPEFAPLTLEFYDA